ncbi:hypothetical protein Tco_0233783 [Tanacetum coccineum]
MSADFAVTYTFVHSKARSWRILFEDPYEEAAQQLLEQAPRSLEYVPDPMELEDHVTVYIPEPEHPEDLVLSEDEAPIEAYITEIRAATPSTYHLLLPSGMPPLLPIPLPAPHTSRRADIPEADTPPQKRLLLTAPRPRGEKDRAAVRAEIGILRRERLAYDYVVKPTKYYSLFLIFPIIQSQLSQLHDPSGHRDVMSKTTNSLSCEHLPMIGYGWRLRQILSEPWQASSTLGSDKLGVKKEGGGNECLGSEATTVIYIYSENGGAASHKLQGNLLEGSSNRILHAQCLSGQKYRPEDKTKALMAKLKAEVTCYECGELGHYKRALRPLVEVSGPCGQVFERGKSFVRNARNGFKTGKLCSEPHPAYDFFTPGPLPGYAGNPNNNNGWIEVDVPLLGELGVVADEPMVGPIVDEIAEPIVEAEEQVIALVIDMDEDIAILFGDDDFEDDDSEGFDE